MISRAGESDVPDRGSYAVVCDAALRMGHIKLGASAPASKFPSGGFASGELRILDDLETIEKIITRPAPTSFGWLNEIRFYIELSCKVVVQDILIPPLKGLRIIDDRSIGMQIGFVEASPILHMSKRERLISGFGRLAAYAHVTRLHDLNWLPKGPGVGPIAESEGVLTAQTLLGEIEGQSWKPFAEFLATAPALRRRYMNCLPTLCHGDASQHNVLAHPDGQNFWIIDWAKVNAGMIGDDLPRLIYPAILVHDAQEIAETVFERESGLFSAYVRGLREVKECVDVGLVRTAFQIRSVVLALGVAKTLREWLSKTSEPANQRIRKARVREFYNLMGARAEKLSHETRIDDDPVEIK